MKPGLARNRRATTGVKQPGPRASQVNEFPVLPVLDLAVALDRRCNYGRQGRFLNLLEDASELLQHETAIRAVLSMLDDMEGMKQSLQ
jgi:hypothetical protein